MVKARLIDLLRYNPECGYESGHGTQKVAPQVGLEPTTDRLTADSSTTELLRNNISLATSYSHRDKVPTTIGARELNFRVRYGNGCDLSAIITKL